MTLSSTMDSTTHVPPVSVWELLAELAACGSNSALLSDLSALLHTISELASTHLQCPWAVLSVRSAGNTTVASNGLSVTERQAFLDAPEDARPLPHIAVPLALDATWAGTLWIGGSERLDLPQSFLVALARQLELLLGMHRREHARHAAQLETARELFILHENSKVLNSSLGLDAMLARVAENVALAMRADRCVIHLRDRAEPGVLVEVASYNFDETADVSAVRYPISGQGPIADLMHTGVSQILGGENDSEPSVLGLRSAVLLPLKSPESVVGLLAIGFLSQDHTFSRAELDLAQSMAFQLATAVTGAMAYDAEQRRARELDALQQLSQRLGAEQPLDDLLHAIMRGIRNFIPFVGAQISLYQAESKQLSIVSRMGLIGDTVPKSTDQEQPFSSGLAGWLGRYQRPLRLTNFERTPVKPAPIWLSNGATPSSYLGMPLLASQQLVGTIELFGDRQSAFTLDHEQLLQLASTQAAQAIAYTRHTSHNDAHLRSRLQQLTALQRISRQLTATLSLDLIFSFALEEALQATTATQAFIALRSGGEEGLRLTNAENAQLIATISLGDDTSSGMFSIVAIAGYSQEHQYLLGQQLSAEGTTAGDALISGEPRLTDLPDHDDRLNGVGPKIGAALAMPIYYENQIVGVVNLYSERDHVFDHDTVEFVRALTDHIALALGNARQYEDQQRQRTLLQQRASMLKQVLDIGQALRADRSVDELLEQIAFSIVDTAGFRRALFNLADQGDPDVIRVVAGAGIMLSELERMRNQPLPKGYVERILDKRFRIGRSFFIPAELAPEVNADLDIDSFTHATPQPVEVIDPNEWQSDDMLFVPLYSTDARLLGILSVDEPYNHTRPNARALEALEVLADQAAIAIENAILLREARAQTDQMRALYQVGKATVSTLSLDELLERVYTEIAAYMGTPAFFYVVGYDEQREMLQFELFKENGKTLETHTKQAAQKAGLTSYVIDTNEVLVIRDYEIEGPKLNAQPVVLNEPVRSWVGIPLRSQNKVIGVLSVQSYEPNAFADRHIRFLGSLANQLAIALENARLFSDREHRIAELDVINDIGRISSTTLDLASMFSQVYDRLRKFLQIDSGYIYAIDVSQADNEIETAFEADGDLRDAIIDPRPLNKSGLTRRVLETRKPLLFQDLRRERRPQGVAPIKFGHVNQVSASWLGVPLMGKNDQIVGVLSIQSYQPNVYGEREQTFLTAVASQVALGIQNARLLRRTQEQVRQLDLLNRATAVASSTLDLDTIYQTIIGVMANAIGVDQAWLLLFDRPRDRAYLAAELKPTSFLGQTVARLKQNLWVYWIEQHRKPLVIVDTMQEPMIEQELAIFSQLDVQSTVIVPLIVGDVVIGVVRFDSVGQSHHFNQQNVELCQMIAQQASTAIEKARLFTEVERNAKALGSKVGELSTLLEAARVLSSSLRPDEVLDRLMDVVGTHLDVNTVGLWKIADGYLRPAALLGIPREIADRMTVPVGQGMTGLVASSGAPLIVADVEQDGNSLYPAFNRERQLTSFMGVPVIYREETVGVLSVMTVKRRLFTVDEQALLAGMADQAAIALENARLFQERGRRIAELTSFNSISQRLNAVLDIDALLRIVHQEIGAVLDVSESFIAVYDAAKEQISYPILWEDGNPSEDHTVLHAVRDPSISRRVISERRTVLLHNVEEMHAYLQEAGYGEDLHTSIASWLSVPLIEGDSVFGIINVQSKLPNKFDADDERYLNTVAGLAATAIARAQLFSERERRLAEVSVLQEISSAITSTLNLQDVLERLHGELGRVVDVTTSFIGLYDASTRMLTYPVAYDHGHPIELPPALMDFGVNSWVIQHRQPLLLDSNEEYLSYQPENAEITRYGLTDALEESYLVAPIISGDDVLGVINIQSYLQHAFTEEDLRFVASVANQAAAAINNARLFQDRGRRIEELSTFNDIGQQFSASPKLNDLIDLIYRQTSRLMDTKNFYIGLYDEYEDSVAFPIFCHEGVRMIQPPLTSTQSLSHYIVRNRQPLLLQGEDQEDRLEELGIVPHGAPSRSWLGVPMVANDQVIGLIAIQDYEQENAYTEENVRLMSTLAQWSAVALANARMFSEQRQSLEELGLLYDMSMQLAGTLDVTEVQRIVVLNAIDLLHVPFGTMTLFDSRQQVTQQFIFDSEQPDSTHDGIGEVLCKLDQQLLQQEKELVIRDLAALPDMPTTQYPVRGMIGEVIGSHEQPLGVLWLGDRHPREWQSRELSMLSIIVTLSSQALKSAYLFEREQSRRVVADTLRNVAERLTGVLKLDDIYTLLFDQLARVVNYNSASLMLRNPEDNTATIVATRGFPENERQEVERVSFNLDESKVLQRIIRTKRPEVLLDARNSPEFLPVAGTNRIQGWIGTPLLLDDDVIGLLAVDSHHYGAYNEEDAQVAFTLVSQAAQAIRNARLFEEVSRFNAELEQRVEERTAALGELNEQLADEKQRLQAVHAITVELTASLELNETLRKTLQLTASYLGVDRGSIMLWDEQKRQLFCRAVLGEGGMVYAENIPIAFRQGGGLAGWVREQQQPICIADVRKDRRWVHERGRAQNVRSVVAVPLRAEGVGTLGVLMLTSPQLNYFTKEQEQLLSTIANEVAIVIHNAELYSLVQDYALKLSDSFNQQKEETVKNQAILRSLGEGVLVLDEDGKVMLLNPAAENILGVFEHTMLGQPLKALIEHDASKQRVKTLYEGMASGLQVLETQGRSQPQRLELSNPAQSLELYFTPVYGQDRMIFGNVMVLRDVTREIEADRAKRDFISSVSHELRTPLTAIKGYVDLLNLGAAGPISETQAQFLGVVKNNANRLMDLINDILEIGRIDSNKIRLNFEPVDLQAILTDAVQTLRSEIERKQMLVQVDIAENLPYVEADERRLTQVVLNMVSNAVKYTYSGGKIELRASLNPSGMVEVNVVDNGVGISPEQQQYLFRRFYRADNPLRDEAGGTGLGLSIAKSFVELHGGEMWVRSDVGEGSTFSFVIPVSQPERPDDEP